MKSVLQSRPKKVRINITMDEELLKEIDRRSLENHELRSPYIRRILREYLKRR